jgi:hypothetical protein
MDCVECDGYVSPSTNRQDYCHDVCSQRGAIKRAIKHLQRADELLALASAISPAANDHVECALDYLCADFDWNPPVAKMGRETWLEGRVRSWTVPGAA